MSERRAFIFLFTGVLLLEAVLMGGLALAGADSETVAAAVVVLLSGAGLGVGFIGVHYH
ncbi:MAG TPA: hypothetical protein VFK14_00850 [Solirubrobacterales bacterium]|nr:hypothetical protein [Solirubrobacterales bacterium]